MSATATQTMQEPGHPEASRRVSVSSVWSARSDTTLIPTRTKQYKGKYFQPDAQKLAAATDGDIIEVPIHEIHMPPRKRLSVIGRMNDRLTGGFGPNEEFKLMRMPKLEYTRYWARDERGNYVGTEPEGLGHERLKAQGW